jgi:hypothetical protein
VIERLKKESSEEEPSLPPKSETALYGTTPRKCLPPPTLPVITRLLLLSMGLGLRIRPLRRLLGGTVVGPTGAQPVFEKAARNTNATIYKSRIFIILNAICPTHIHN